MRPYSHFHFVVWLEKDDPTIGDDPSLMTQFYFKDETPPFPEVLQLEVTEVDYSRFNYGSYVNGQRVARRQQQHSMYHLRSRKVPSIQPPTSSPLVMI